MFDLFEILLFVKTNHFITFDIIMMESPEILLNFILNTNEKTNLYNYRNDNSYFM